MFRFDRIEHGFDDVEYVECPLREEFAYGVCDYDYLNRFRLYDPERGEEMLSVMGFEDVLLFRQCVRCKRFCLDEHYDIYYEKCRRCLK